MNRRALIFLSTGLIAAIVAGIVVFILLSNIRQGTPQTGSILPGGATPVPTRVVLVAATDIVPNSVITRSQVVTATFPADLVPADAIKNISEVLGSTATSSVFSGQILLQRQFIAAAGRTGASVNIPPGKVLVAFPSTDMLNSTGAVQPGDRVDILLTIPISGTSRLDSGAPTGSQLAPGSRAIVTQGTIQNIEVYTVGLWSPPGQQPANSNANNREGAGLKIITFIVDHQEALILKFIKDNGGTIDLVVRSAQDNQIAQTDPVTIDYLVDLYGFIGLVTPAQPTP